MYMHHTYIYMYTPPQTPKTTNKTHVLEAPLHEAAYDARLAALGVPDHQQLARRDREPAREAGGAESGGGVGPGEPAVALGRGGGGEGHLLSRAEWLVWVCQYG